MMPPNGRTAQSRRRAEPDEVIGLDRRADRAPDRDSLLLGRALDGMPVDDIVEGGIVVWGMCLGHDDLHWAEETVREVTDHGRLLSADC
jgi:hypothetical protein